MHWGVPSMYDEYQACISHSEQGQTEKMMSQKVVEVIAPEPVVAPVSVLGLVELGGVAQVQVVRRF